MKTQKMTRDEGASEVAAGRRRPPPRLCQAIWSKKNGTLSPNAWGNLLDRDPKSCLERWKITPSRGLRRISEPRGAESRDFAPGEVRQQVEEDRRRGPRPTAMPRASGGRFSREAVPSSFRNPRRPITAPRCVPRRRRRWIAGKRRARKYDHILETFAEKYVSILIQHCKELLKKEREKLDAAQEGSHVAVELAGAAAESRVMRGGGREKMEK
ncbi:hypothetical protein DH2020_037741 [Rehmannia glutinosa]|uniref:Uncharacterized protein n=1 Tax=Rehmannia glutinosa TaxID=99300 RepID=A0ABR0V335_REHGL